MLFWNSTFTATRAITAQRFALGLLGWLALTGGTFAQSNQTWINGSGTWDTVNTSWDGGVVWTNGNNAIFAGSAETVSILGNVSVNQITFNSSGFVIADPTDSGALSLANPSLITVTTAGHSATISENLATGGITKAGNGTLIMSGNNSFAGDVLVSNGRLTIASNTGLGSNAGGTSVADGAQLTLANGVTVTGESLSIAGSGLSFTGALQTASNATATWAGPVVIGTGGRVGSEPSGVLSLTGPISGGSLILSAFGSDAAAGVLVVSNTSNSYTGATSIFRGVLRLGATNALPVTTTLDVDAANSPTEPSVFDLAGFNQTVGQLTRSANSAGGSFITNSGASASTLTVNQSATSSFSGILQDGVSALNLSKSGSGTLTLSGVNTFSGSTTVNAGILAVGHASALGSTVGSTTVVSGATLVLNDGITVTGESLSIAGTGNSSNGALQTATGASATWAGDISAASGSRMGGGVGGSLTVAGVISGSGSILFNRANNSTTVLQSVNTYTGTTQLFSNGGTGSRLVMGVDNAINAASTLGTINAPATVVSVLDLNGRVLTLAGLDSSTNHASGAFLQISNGAAGPSTLTVSGASNFSFTGTITNGIGTTHLVKSGTNTQALLGVNSYSGQTTVNAGVLQIGGSIGTFGSSGALTASSQINLVGGTFALNNLGTNNNSANRLTDTIPFSFQGGSFLYQGSDQAATPSTETLGTLTLSQRVSTFTSTFGSSNTATVTASELQRSANGGIALVNGLNLGRDGTSSASTSRLILTTAPALVGTTAALPTGINAAAKNTQIVPFLHGAVTAASGGLGTAGIGNTFVTYHPDTGLRPLNLTDEFTTNAFTSGHNTRLTAPATVSSSVAINSLLLESANLTISSGQTLTVNSGAILINGTAPVINGGTLAFGTQEGLITGYSTGNTFLSSPITGSAGLSLYGTTQFVVNQQSTFTGNTALYANAVPQSSSIGSANAPTSGPFGRSTLILAGGTIRSSSGADVILHNPIHFQADTAIPVGSVNRTLTFAGDVTLTTGSRVLTHNSTSNTLFTGAIGESTAGSGLTITGTSTSAVVLSGANTYTGPTLITGSGLHLTSTGSLAAASAVTVNGPSAALSGTGTVFGPTTILSGSLFPGGNQGADAGLFTFGSDLILGGTLTLNLDGITRGVAGGYDALNIGGTLTYGGNLNLIFGTTFDPLDSFSLFDFVNAFAPTGSFADISYSGIYGSGTLTNQLDGTWASTAFRFTESTGSLLIIPEPSRALLSLLALALIGLHRRRPR
jgi:autotransporter-associated beta strand protein